MCPLIEEVLVYEVLKYVLMCKTCSFCSDTKKPNVLGLVQHGVALSLKGDMCYLQRCDHHVLILENYYLVFLVITK